MVLPSQVRLSDSFLLSDFMGNNSVYTKGLRNIFDFDDKKLAQGRYLCEALLENLLLDFGPMSISYGYISPELSGHIVKYMNPNEPSYHRWEKGAAADILIHDILDEDFAPVHLAHAIDAGYEYSRMITYSESPYICVATNIEEPAGSPRCAFYENRYTGVPKAKPQYIKKPNSLEARAMEGSRLVLPHGWIGAGYPTYHGGGTRQVQHIRVSKYSMISDYLYDDRIVMNGGYQKVIWDEYRRQFRRAGRVYDHLIETLQVRRISIVSGFKSALSLNKRGSNWEECFDIDVIPPLGVSQADVVEAAYASDLVEHADYSGLDDRVNIRGKPCV